jgi:hypothetical protein
MYFKDMLPPSQDVEVAFYKNDTAIIARSRKPSVLVRYLESYLNDLQRWLG